MRASSHYIITGGLLILLAGVGMFVWRNTTHLEVTSSPKVRIAVLNLTSNFPQMIAQEEKLFEKEGITPEFIPFQSSNQVVEAMIRGDIDIGMFSLTPFFTVEQKEPGKLKVYNTSRMSFDHPFEQMIVKKESTITDIQQLAGKKIGVFPGTSATSFAKDYLKKQGVDVASIEFVQLPAQNQLPAFEAGSIDALYAYEPTLTIAVTKGARTISPSIFASFIDPNPVGVGVMTNAFITQHPETAKKTVAVIDAAIRFQSEQESAARVIAKNVFGFDQVVADRFSMTPISENKNIDKEKVREFATKAVSLGELSAIPNTDAIYYQP